MKNKNPKSNSAHLFYGDWYKDRSGRLYIAPAAPNAPVFGPNDFTKIRMKTMYRRGEPEVSEVAEALDLNYVPVTRRSFDKERGYIVA